MRSQILISLLFLSLSTQAFGYKQSALDTFLLMNICEKCDLSEANFERADLSGADLLGANLREANLREANLR
ncbi:MAG: pentapeptide repeat-containing protein, partial [SAR324 cluster bacterium]|nr:pentapeptide repeat-containing protein [SAR324 cluster bacterium]